MKNTLLLLFLLPLLSFGQIHYGGSIGINNSRYIGSAFDSDYVGPEIQFLSTPSFQAQLYTDLESGVGIKTGIGIAQYGLKTKGDPYWEDMISIDKRTYLTIPLRAYAYIPEAKISPIISFGFDTRIAFSGSSITNVDGNINRVNYSDSDSWDFTKRVGVAPTMSMGIWKKKGLHNYLVEFEFAVNQVPLYKDNFPIDDFEARELSFSVLFTYLFSKAKVD